MVSKGDPELDVHASRRYFDAALLKKLPYRRLAGFA